MDNIKYVLRCHLKELCERDGISANKLATAIDERRSTLNDLINNNDMETRHIPARLIAKLCGYFKVSPAELFTTWTINIETDEERRIEIDS
ncbi:helix-turn-helix domain-containing protein [Peribacillus frigoritolerans]|uniref:Helix-turn-helix transcriptional regulator n=1 Tax=Peribacillus frigoritolerans TaxID=450367 RepID=A0AAJ1QKM9_9BACI|nr:helix-turn-helix transcriptional regulator [Peribacillus frigoritolerans]MDM5283115.1 helix-turn-helix transcriptional regulator [Peribacillus frigoritolerans]